MTRAFLVSLGHGDELPRSQTARFAAEAAPGVRMGGTVEEALAGPTGAAASPAFNAAKVADNLVSATGSVANKAAKLIETARQLSSMAEVSAPQKVEVILEFLKRIGFTISKEGVVDDGASLVMKAENGQSAFRFVKATGKILYGKFDAGAMDYAWSEL